MKKYKKIKNEKKMNAANNFGKDFFKLMINSAYGKTMENLRKRISLKLVNNTEETDLYYS